MGLDLNRQTQNCAKSQNQEGIIVPDCPPSNEIEITEPNAFASFYIIARSSREPELFGKATPDLLFDNGGS